MKTFSLRTRLTLLLGAAVLVALGIAAKVVDWRADSEMQRRFDTTLLARAQAFTVLVRNGANGVQIDAVADQMGRFPGGAPDNRYAVVCAGKVIAQSNPAPPPVATGAAPRFASERVDGHTWRVVALQFHPAGAHAAQVAGAAPQTCELRYALDRDQLNDILRRLDWILIGSLLGALALVLILTPWLVDRGLRPLAALDRAMAGIGPEAPGGRLPASNTTELVAVVARFNEVLGRMDDGLARERQFASGLAHEFRTRLAELRALVDVETRYPSGHDVGTVLGEVGSIGAELEATVTALLQLTRIQSGLEQSVPEGVALQPLLARVLTRHVDAAQARGVRIESKIDCGQVFEIDADQALLEIVLDNLLGNAVAYAPAGSVVALRAGQDAIDVDNAAPALQPDDLANLGQRFWRKGAQGSGHAGLGLALAGAAARALEMRLDFSLRDGELRATLAWTTH